MVKETGPSGDLEGKKHSMCKRGEKKVRKMHQALRERGLTEGNASNEKKKT